MSGVRRKSETNSDERERTVHVCRQEKKNRGYSYTNLYSDIQCDVMIAILCLLTSRSLKRSDEEEEEEKREETGLGITQFVWNMGSERREERNTNYTIHFHLFSIATNCYQANKQMLVEMTMMMTIPTIDPLFPQSIIISINVYIKEKTLTSLYSNNVYSKQESTDIYIN